MRRSVAPLPGAGGKEGDSEAAAAAALARKRARQRLAEESGLIKALPGLYGQLGGSSAISAVVELALEKAQANWKVKRFVEGANVQQLVRGGWRAVGGWLAGGWRSFPARLPVLTRVRVPLPPPARQQGDFVAAAFGGPVPYT